MLASEWPWHDVILNGSHGTPGALGELLQFSTVKWTLIPSYQEMVLGDQEDSLKYNSCLFFFLNKSH